MANPPGKCIYCDGTPLSKEHIWADWLSAYIPRVQTETTYLLTIKNLDGTDHRIKRRQGDPHGRKIRRVCESCNNGWMSQLQEATKPYLVPMLHGAPIDLRKRGQTLIATWVAMMVIIGEHENPRAVTVPAGDRYWLRLKKCPPHHWRIWIGRHSRTHHPLWSHHGLSLTKEPPERIPLGTTDRLNTHATTVCVGKHLVIFVMSSGTVKDVIRNWRLPPDLASRMLPIWPIKAPMVRWPAAGAPFDDSELRRLSRQFGDRADAILDRMRRDAASASE